MQAGCELGLGAEDASAALRGQICRPIEDWNDHPQRTHAEVIAAFEATIAALASCPAGPLIYRVSESLGQRDGKLISG
jgi:hypothetical protein